MQTPIKLSIIIISWNTVNLLEQCLVSVFACNIPAQTEIIVADNNSSDKSVAMVREKFPEVKLIVNSENLGFAKANNRVILQSKGEYILLLNSDTIICDDQVIANMIDYMDTHEEVGACGCQLIFPDGKHQVGDAGFKPTPAALLHNTFFTSKLFSHRCKSFFLNYDKYQCPIEVDWISGADFFIRSNIIPEVGLLNEETFMFAEDIEWGCRIREYGYKVVYLADNKIIHLQGASSKKQKEKNFSTLWLDNLKWLFLKYNPHFSPLLFDLCMSISFFVRWFVYFLFGQINGDQEKKIKSNQMARYFKYSLSNLFGTAK